MRPIGLCLSSRFTGCIILGQHHRVRKPRGTSWPFFWAFVRCSSPRGLSFLSRESGVRPALQRLKSRAELHGRWNGVLWVTRRGIGDGGGSSRPLSRPRAAGCDGSGPRRPRLPCLSGKRYSIPTSYVLLFCCLFLRFACFDFAEVWKFRLGRRRGSDPWFILCIGAVDLFRPCCLDCAWPDDDHEDPDEWMDGWIDRSDQI